MTINYHGKTFKGIANVDHGQVSSETVFHYQQQAMVLTASYAGGQILKGYMLGKVLADNSLHFAYHHLDVDGQLKSGYCTSRPEILPDGRIRLYETWAWTYGGEGHGESIVEEV